MTKECTYKELWTITILQIYVIFRNKRQKESVVCVDEGISSALTQNS